MMSQSVQQIITKYILSNISQNKDNQTMSFGKLIRYKKINVFI